MAQIDKYLIEIGRISSELGHEVYDLVDDEDDLSKNTMPRLKDFETKIQVVGHAISMIALFISILILMSSK